MSRFCKFVLKEPISEQELVRKVKIGQKRVYLGRISVKIVDCRIIYPPKNMLIFSPDGAFLGVKSAKMTVDNQKIEKVNFSQNKEKEGSFSQNKENSSNLKNNVNFILVGGKNEDNEGIELEEDNESD